MNGLMKVRSAELILVVHRTKCASGEEFSCSTALAGAPKMPVQGDHGSVITRLINAAQSSGACRDRAIDLNKKT